MIFIYVDLTGISGCGFDLFGIATGWVPSPHLKLLKISRQTLIHQYQGMTMANPQS